MSTPNVLRPQITVTLQSGDVTVRDLPWQDALEFLRKLSGHAKELLASSTSDGRVDISTLLPRLTDLVTNVQELSQFLLLSSTGKDEAWLKGLGTIEAMAVLDAALEVNLSDGLLELGKKVAGRLARVMPAKVRTSVTPPSAIS
ncbi:MAG: hypothetical protein V4773_04275 [Verrucomicrobiota bacterium]